MLLLRILFVSAILALAACGGGGGSSNSGTIIDDSAGDDNNSGGNGDNSDDDNSGGDTDNGGDSGGDNNQALNGGLVYMEPQDNGNTFACAHCHAVSEPADDGFSRPGHAIGDAPRRASFKNGQLDKFIDAANICLKEWMAVPTPWTEETPEYQALVEFLDEQDEGEGEAPALTFQQAAPLTFENNDAVSGDASAGQAKFNTSCAICHGQNAAGTERAPKLAGNLSYNGAPDYIARRVRTSGSTDSEVYPDLTGGRMPFWADDRVSDDDLENIIEYLINSTADTSDDNADDDDNNTGGTGACSSTHPSIGKTATLKTRFHGVTGTATIVNDCTIQLDGFNYDGQGITVHFYGSIDENYDDSSQSFIMGGNLVRESRPYEDETLFFTLPNGKTLDDMNSISIWCVPAKVSFGDGVFE